MIEIQFYNTSSIAKLIGIHPNTVRLYEEQGLITTATRKENGYRVFTDLHVHQFQLARMALQIEILQNGLRKKAIDIIKETAKCDFDRALELCEQYILQLDCEIKNAYEAVKIVKDMTSKKTLQSEMQFKRKDVSLHLDISMDTLRNWEMNGLLNIKRKENGYRVYTGDDIRRLKIIRTLKCANYSLLAILRMLNELDKDGNVDIEKLLNNPLENEEIISVCDKLIISLNKAKANAKLIKELLHEMKIKFSNPPL